MTVDESARDELLATTRARLDRLQADLHKRDAQPAPTYEAARSAALGTAVVAVQYARDITARIVGDLAADATAEVSAVLDGLVECSSHPWGDTELSDLGNLTERSSRLLADVWMLGRLTAAVDPQSWSTDVLVQQCLQVVAETHLAGKLRAELDGMFGETDEPG